MSRFPRWTKGCLPKAEQRCIDHCQEHLIKWSCPREIEFRSELPKTLIGKIDFKVLQQEEIRKLEQRVIGPGI